MSLERRIAEIVEEQVSELGRPDLYRTPLVAFADAHDPRFLELKEIIGNWVCSPAELLPSARSVISYFVPFTREVALAPSRSSQVSAVWGESYAVINAYFDRINGRICEHLAEQGFEAAAVPAMNSYSAEDIRSIWSHRSAAVIAGLGYFSANRLVVTEKGSAGRYNTVFTSAPLDLRRDPPTNRCAYLADRSCGKCFAACPVGALHPGDLDKPACLAETLKNERFLAEHARVENADVCGKCIAACPLAYFD